MFMNFPMLFCLFWDSFLLVMLWFVVERKKNTPLPGKQFFVWTGASNFRKRFSYLIVHLKVQHVLEHFWFLLLRLCTFSWILLFIFSFAPAFTSIGLFWSTAFDKIENLSLSSKVQGIFQSKFSRIAYRPNHAEVKITDCYSRGFRFE
jgi:hypothetical protein